MDIDWIREYCLALLHTTEKVQWGNDLVFKVGEKMYAVVALEPGDQWLGFKCTPEDFTALIERPGIIPAPYLARAHWVSLETSDALPRTEVERLLRQAYSVIFAKLPKKVQAGLLVQKKSKGMTPRRTSARHTPRCRKTSARGPTGKGR
jgi:predicted DNA-binding protein (MmcQ/YjbR family)